MTSDQSIKQAWHELPAGARAALELSSAGALGQAARSGAPLQVALAPWNVRIERTAHQVASKEQLK